MCYLRYKSSFSCLFFFSSRRRHTSWPRDSSSDVCSSDLGTKFAPLSTLEPATWVPTYGPVFQLNANDLGGVKGFGFSFFSTDGVNVDLAPNRGSWSYQLAPLEPGIRA